MIHHEHKRNISALICILTVLCMLLGCAKKEAEPITSLEQLNSSDRKIGMAADINGEKLLAEKLPEAKIEYYQEDMTGYMAVSQGKLDAFVYGKLAMETAIQNGMRGVRLLDETLGESYVMGVGLSQKTRIPDLETKINAFLDEVKSDGTLEEMADRWLVRKETEMPEIPIPETSDTHLVVGTSGVYEPFTFYVGTELAGYDIELARRFAAWLGATIEFRAYDYDGIVAAAQSGDVDCIFAALFITPERQEKLLFSQPTYVEEIAVMVRGDSTTQKPSTDKTVHWQDYNGKKLGVLVGPLMEDTAKEFFPDSEYMLLDSYPDCVTALLSGKIDGFLGDEPGMKSLHAEQPEVDYIHESLTENNYSFAFRKNDPESAALCAELNAFLKKSWEDGTMEELDVWFGVDEAKKVVDMSDLTGENGTIRVVTTSTDMPWSYIKDGKNVGYDIDLVVRFCRDRGYAVEFGDVDFAGRIPAIQSGKYDFTTDMNVTPERMEQVLFSDPTSHGGIVLAVRASDLNPDDGEEITLDSLNGKRFGVETGTIDDVVAQNRLKDIEISRFNSVADMIPALKSGKIDAFAADDAVIRLYIAEDDALMMVPELLNHVDTAAAFPKTEKGAALRDEFNAFLKPLIENGELESIREIWLGSDDSKKTIPPLDALTGENGTLTMATVSVYPPLDYYKDGQLVGYEIDLAYRFCKARGYRLVLQDMNFDSVLPSIQSGKCDFAAAFINITEERKESVYFSDPIYTGGSAVCVLKPNATVSGVGYQNVDELSGKRIGVVTGAIHDALVERRLPSAQIVYFNTVADMLDALKAGKIDALVRPLSSAIFIHYEDKSISWLDEHLTDADVGFAFPKTEKGKALNERFSDYIRTVRASGELDALREKWFGEDASVKTMIDLTTLPAANGTLLMATTGAQVPFNYVRDNTVVGFEIELAARFCEENGYGLSVEQMNFDGVLASVQSGKCDFAGACLAVTDERKESVDFSEPHYSDSVVFVVLNVDETDSAGGFLASIGESFHKTFIRENRWQLFLQGIGTTMLITVLSVLFGTILGFAVFMLCRNGNPVANFITRFFVWLVQGMPVVVLLMILYYIIFGKVNISGAAVSVVGFTLVFGAAVFGMLRSGVGAIDKGQLEAAYALGYTNRKAFFRIILPQALPHFMPAYKGEITALIKATAVVGYVAVQDLTKMGDIVRSRTYEAFFPLIAVAIIYFILAAILTFLVNKIEIRIDPRRRSKKQIMKGVKTDD